MDLWIGEGASSLEAKAAAVSHLSGQRDRGPRVFS